MPVENINRPPHHTALDTDTPLAIIRRLPRPPLMLAFEVLLRARVAVRMAVLILHAVLTNIAEALAVRVLRGPSVVHAVLEAIRELDGSNNAPTRGALYHRPGLLITEGGDVLDVRGWITPAYNTNPLPIRLRRARLEMRRQVMLPTLAVRSNVWSM